MKTHLGLQIKQPFNTEQRLEQTSCCRQYSKQLPLVSFETEKIRDAFCPLKKSSASSPPPPPPPARPPAVIFGCLRILWRLKNPNKNRSTARLREFNANVGNHFQLCPQMLLFLLIFSLYLHLLLLFQHVRISWKELSTSHSAPASSGSTSCTTTPTRLSACENAELFPLS